MEFWGVEVKPGKPFKVSVQDGTVIHLSQASFAEIKKGKESETTPLFVTVNGQKLVVGHLSPEKFPSEPFDLVFETDFEISHNSKNGSVHFTGYTSEVPEEEGDCFDCCESDDEEEPELIPVVNAKPIPKVVDIAKPTAAKPQPKKDSKAVEIDDEDDDDSDSDDEEDDEEDSDDEDESDEEEEETPKKVEITKKRAVETPNKTPVPAKKAKAASPSDVKNSGRVGTPHPSKKGGKSPGAPKSGGKHSHNKGKHSGGK
jgi:hypothetical protein